MENVPEIGGPAHGLAAQARADWIERLAFGAALLCLIHCLALPIALAALPALSRILSLPEDLHLWLLALAGPASTLALGGSRGETPVTVAGSLLLAAAHVLNWRRRHACHCHG